MREERSSKETGSSQQAGRVRGDGLTGNYSQDGKTKQRSGKWNGKQARRTTVNDQHGMTERTPATETREVSQPLRTPGKNLVLSEPTSTVKKTIKQSLKEQV